MKLRINEKKTERLDGKRYEILIPFDREIKVEQIRPSDLDQTTYIYVSMPEFKIKAY